VNRLRKIGFCLIAGAAAAAWADDAGLQRCRTLTDSTQRLACYDALPLGTTPKSATPAAQSTPGAPASSPAAAPAPAASSSQSLLSRFGFENRPQPDELPYVESYIPGLFEGWKPRARITLANGQVWQVIDETNKVTSVENPKVKITRGTVGSFFLEIDRINPSPRVRRVQ
jgi:hypothetical protein